MSAVSQRTAAAGVQTAAEASEGTGQEESTSQRTPRSRYPYLKVPTWYEHAHFQYTRRFVLALVPGLFLLGVAEGANIFAALSICALVIFLVHQGGGSWISVILTLTSMLTLSVVSMYSVAPLIWRSILNYPIALVAHYILLCCGGLALIQLRAFQDYDPSMTVMMEKALFSAFPMALVLPVVWEHLMLFQVTYLPYTVTLTWFVGLSLFVVPLKSSFAKHNTPLHEALVLHKLAAQAYMGLFLVVPLLLNLTFIRHSNPLNALLSTVLFIFLPAFLLTLLESQGIFYWIGVSPTLPPFLRQVFGAVVLVAGSMLLYRSGESGLLLLALPLAAVQLLAVSASGEGAEGVSMRKVLATACVGITYIGGFIALPWHIVHSLESVVSLPLQAVQVALLALALSSVAMFVFWRQLSSAGVWLVYTAAFVSCEHLLLQERVYPPLLLLLTAALGSAVLQRLWSVRHISRNAAWLCISLHVTKLTQLLLPAASSLASVALAHCAVFLVAAAVSRLVLYQTRKNLKPSHWTPSSPRCG